MKTTGDRPLRSPFQDSPDDPFWVTTALTSIAAPGKRVALAALEESGQLELRGTAAGESLASALGIQPPPFGKALHTRKALIAQLRPDHWLAVTGSWRAASVLAKSIASDSNENGGLLTLTDVTHGRACLLLVGIPAAEVLARLCGLDFSSRAFPHTHVVQTSLARVKALLIRWNARDLPAYFISVDRSLARYVRRAIWKEMEAFDPALLKTETVIDEWPAARNGAAA